MILVFFLRILSGSGSLTRIRFLCIQGGTPGYDFLSRSFLIRLLEQIDRAYSLQGTLQFRWTPLNQRMQLRLHKHSSASDWFFLTFLFIALTMFCSDHDYSFFEYVFLFFGNYHVIFLKWIVEYI